MDAAVGQRIRIEMSPEGGGKVRGAGAPRVERADTGITVESVPRVGLFREGACWAPVVAKAGGLLQSPYCLQRAREKTEAKARRRWAKLPHRLGIDRRWRRRQKYERLFPKGYICHQPSYVACVRETKKTKEVKWSPLQTALLPGRGTRRP